MATRVRYRGAGRYFLGVTTRRGRGGVPAVGRLGLLDPDAEKNLSDLGWNNEESIELLWSLSRSPDADLALRAIVRMRSQLGDDWSEIDTLLRTDKGFRGRFLAVLGSSDALGDHMLSLIHISEPTRRHHVSRMPSSA